MVLGVLLVAAGLTIGVRAYRGIHQLGALADRLAGLQSRATELRAARSVDLTVVEAEVASASEEITSARGKLTPLLQLSPALAWIPFAGPRLSAAADGLDFASELVAGLQPLLAAATGLVDSLGPGAQVMQADTLDPRLLDAVRAEAPRFAEAAEHFSQALAARDRIDLDRVPTAFRAALQGSEDSVAKLHQLSQLAATVGMRVHSIFGYEQPRTYLVLAHNSDELRATGGFIPGAWLVTWDAGRLARLDFWDTVDVDRLVPQAPLPPEGLLVSLWAGTWLFRDAGWFPDFPTSATVAERLFESGPGVAVDGVVGMNQWAVVEIVRALGNVRLPDGATLTESSYLAVLEARTDQFGRGFIDTMLRAMFDRLGSQVEPAASVKLLAAFAAALDHKDLLFSFHDPVLRTFAADAGWDGSLRPAAGDYLMAVDSNVGINKVNRNVELTLNYSVRLEADGRGEGSLQLVYSNRSVAGDACALQGTDPERITYDELKQACYWNYLRVYVPLGAQLLETTPLPMPAGALYQRLGYADIADTLLTYSESEKQVFAGLLTVAPQATRVVAFGYAVPQVSRKNGRELTYTLYVQKQPGVPDAKLRVTVRPPVGYRLQQASLLSTTARDGEVMLEATLDRDLTIKTVFRES